jgi:subtilisin family serine protease
MRLTGRLDITIRSLGWRGALALAAAAAVAIPVAAQSLDSTLDDIIDDQIDEQVENDVADALEDTVEQQVEEQVEQQVQSEVAETIEQQVESSVTETVEQQIQSEVVETIQQEVESGVTATIEQQVESGVTEGIGRQLENAISEAVESGLDAVDEVDDVAHEVGNGLEEVLGEAEDVVESAADENSGGSEEGEDGAPREQFFAAIDAAGRAIERDVWVILLPREHAARIEGWGFTVRERQDLATLDRLLLRVDAPEDRDIAQAALELALDAPGTLVDFNHVYRGGADADSTPAGSAATGRPAFEGQPVSAARPRPPLAIGIIDSAVANEHAAFHAADIVQKDFVPFEGTRPLRHGTAVASILVGESRSVRPRLPGARLYAAAVFFDDDGEPAATTASLVASLEWLAAERVGVVNMSLAGPPNRVLEAALGDTASRGAVVVAAVGNNGPVGEPLYPAAYETVVGVTAVDSANRIYRYASRGRQVTFAAPGVRIKVAQSDGGYGTETGTSMAAPHAAAIIAQSMAARAAQPAEAVLSSLEAAAIDLGDEDFDDVFGFGLIAAID